MTTRTKPSRLAAVALEQRAVKLDRSAVAADSRAFTGHAAVYNQRTAIGNPLQWGFYELVAPGAFDKSLRDGDVVQLADHDPAKPIARMSVGTLKLASDATGLAVDVPQIPNVSYGDDLIENVRVGNVQGMSFGFRVVQDDWATETVSTSDGMTAEVEVRTLLEVQLIEVSTTAFPAYTGTDAGLRCVRAARQSQRARGGRGARRIPLRTPQAVAGSLRVGKTISAATMTQLQAAQDALTEFAGDDDNVAAAADILDGLINDPIPDNDEDDDDTVDEAAAETKAQAGDERRVRAAQLRARQLDLTALNLQPA